MKLVTFILGLMFVTVAQAQLNTNPFSSSGTPSVIASGTTTPNTLSDRFGREFWVEDFGAKGDDVTDDTVAVQNAINAAWAVGGIVRFSFKAYKLGNLTLPAGDDGNNSSLALVGLSENYIGEIYSANRKFGTRLRFYKTDGTDFITISNATYHKPAYRIENLTIIGPDTNSPRTTTSGNAIKFSASVPKVYMNNVSIALFFGGAGLWFGGDVEQSTFENILITRCATGIHVDSTGVFNANRMINFNVDTNIIGGTIDGGESNTWMGGVIQSNEKSGLNISQAIDWDFINLHFENNNTTSDASSNALRMVTSALRSIQYLRFSNCTFNFTRDSIYMSGYGPAQGIIGVMFVGGYANPVASPTITIANAFVTNTVIDNFSGDFSDSGNYTRSYSLSTGISTTQGLILTSPADTTALALATRARLKFGTGANAYFYGDASGYIQTPTGIGAVFYSANATSGNTGYTQNTGARLDLGAGTLDYLYSDGTASRSGGNFITNGTLTIGSSGTSITSSVRCTATLGTSTITNGTTATQTISCTGAAVGAECVVGGSAALEAGLIQTCLVSATNTILLRTANVTATSITPADNQTISVRVFNP